MPPVYIRPAILADDPARAGIGIEEIRHGHIRAGSHLFQLWNGLLTLHIVFYTYQFEDHKTISVRMLLLRTGPGSMRLRTFGRWSIDIVDYWCFAIQSNRA